MSCVREKDSLASYHLADQRIKWPIGSASERNQCANRKCPTRKLIPGGQLAPATRAHTHHRQVSRRASGAKCSQPARVAPNRTEPNPIRSNRIRSDPTKRDQAEANREQPPSEHNTHTHTSVGQAQAHRHAAETPSGAHAKGKLEPRPGGSWAPASRRARAKARPGGDTCCATRARHPRPCGLRHPGQPVDSFRAPDPSLICMSNTVCRR